MEYKLINVSVANLYREPTFNSEITTQALLGEEVELLDRQNGFSLIRLPDNYQNWINDSQLCNPRSFPERRVTVRSHHLLIYSEPDTRSQKLRDVTIGRRLPCIDEQGGWLQVVMPNGEIGWAENKHFGEFPPLSRKSVIELAREFIGYPYYWGGKSPKGLDCSGFTQLLFSLLGKSISRDAWMQYRDSSFVSDDYSKAQAGDLYFFGKNKENVDHIGIALGDAKMVHATGMIQINSLNSEDSGFSPKSKDKFLSVKTYFECQI